MQCDFSMAQQLRQTLAEDMLVAECPECGYPLEQGSCANCGYSAGRVQPRAEHAFVLTPLRGDTGEQSGNPKHFQGGSVILNRNNVAPKNPTVTSKEQALVAFADGVWTIQDKSEYNTTFVQAARPVPLRDGDLVLLGDQLYRFNLS